MYAMFPAAYGGMFAQDRSTFLLDAQSAHADALFRAGRFPHPGLMLQAQQFYHGLLRAPTDVHQSSWRHPAWPVCLPPSNQQHRSSLPDFSTRNQLNDQGLVDGRRLTSSNLPAAIGDRRLKSNGKSAQAEEGAKERKDKRENGVELSICTGGQGEKVLSLKLHAAHRDQGSIKNTVADNLPAGLSLIRLTSDEDIYEVVYVSCEEIVKGTLVENADNWTHFCRTVASGNFDAGTNEFVETVPHGTEVLLCEKKEKVVKVRKASEIDSPTSSSISTGSTNLSSADMWNNSIGSESHETNMEKVSDSGAGQHKAGFQCERCGKMFSYAYYRDKHLKYTRCVDLGNRKYPCALCSRSFEKRDRLRIHVLHVHENHRPHSCAICGKRFSQSSSLNKHLRVHSGERPYKCAFCTKAFTASSILRTHVRQHSGEKPFKCKYCGKAFASHAAHDSHVRRSHSATDALFAGATAPCSQEQPQSSPLPPCGDGHAFLSTGDQFAVATGDVLRRSLASNSTRTVGHRIDKITAADQLGILAAGGLKFTADGVRAHSCAQCGKQFYSEPHLLFHTQLLHGNKVATEGDTTA